ncbi:hypothetical protein J6590_013865 [Homalodisca vitripennis]|nr:hypothetical protein J6590_013865 [Homalodisca vitripennis]
METPTCRRFRTIDSPVLDIESFCASHFLISNCNPETTKIGYVYKALRHTLQEEWFTVEQSRHVHCLSGGRMWQLTYIIHRPQVNIAFPNLTGHNVIMVLAVCQCPYRRYWFYHVVTWQSLWNSQDTSTVLAGAGCGS